MKVLFDRLASIGIQDFVPVVFRQFVQQRIGTGHSFWKRNDHQGRTGRAVGLRAGRLDRQDEGFFAFRTTAHHGLRRVRVDGRSRSRNRQCGPAGTLGGRTCHGIGSLVATATTGACYRYRHEEARGAKPRKSSRNIQPELLYRIYRVPQPQVPTLRDTIPQSGGWWRPFPGSRESDSGYRGRRQ